MVCVWMCVDVCVDVCVLCVCCRIQALWMGQHVPLREGHGSLVQRQFALPVPASHHPRCSSGCWVECLAWRQQACWWRQRVSRQPCAAAGLPAPAPWAVTQRWHAGLEPALMQWDGLYDGVGTGARRLQRPLAGTKLGCLALPHLHPRQCPHGDQEHSSAGLVAGKHHPVVAAAVH